MLDVSMESNYVDNLLLAAKACGVTREGSGEAVTISPITGDRLFDTVTDTDTSGPIATSILAATAWAGTPAPNRGKVLLHFAELLRQHQSELATLITAEVGKPGRESSGEIAEIIEMCVMTAGMSHQLYGRTLPSSRPGFRLMETFHPVGPVAIITPFSFPGAAWGWSAPLALLAGNPVLWKPSPQAPVTAHALASLLSRSASECGAPDNLCQVLEGGNDTALSLAQSEDIPVVTAYGRSSTGRAIGRVVSKRLGRSILQLGGNNAAVVTPSADLDLAISGIVAAATSAAGQRCTTMRRLIVHEDVIDEVSERVVDAYAKLKIGDPRLSDLQVGPLINEKSYLSMRTALAQAEQDGGTILTGGERVHTEHPRAYYVRPALVRMPKQTEVVATETVAPILYLLTYSDFEEAIALNNAVEHGFSSSVYTTDQSEAERFLSGSDCGIINVNLHTSGAEVSTAFGGDKATGGGRQCGTDAWKNYARRVTSAIS